MPVGTEVTQSVVNVFDGANTLQNPVGDDECKGNNRNGDMTRSPLSPQSLPKSQSMSALPSACPSSSSVGNSEAGQFCSKVAPLPTILEASHNGGLHHDKDENYSNSMVAEFRPTIRSGVWFDIGPRSVMEDAHVAIDNLVEHLDSITVGQEIGSFYGVFDGHGGRHAAQFMQEKLLSYIVRDAAFPTAVEEAVHHAFLHADTAFAEVCSVDHAKASGTTALTVLVLGRKLFVANAGDCRAVLCRKGRAIELSRDHKPSCKLEKSRIEAQGGFVYDGYLNGHLSVARAIGNWHIKGLKGVNCPLSAEPEVKQSLLTEEDEFLIIGCDGLWDVFSSQNAVDFARKKLQEHNDPQQCSRDLVDEALRRESGDNLTVVTVCFHNEPPPKLITKFVVRRSISAEGLRSLQDVLDRSC